jgi:hypothetical protein
MTDEKKNIEADQAPDQGVFITKGMQVTIPSFSIRLKDDGSLDADPVILHTRIDLCPYWMEIALIHLEDSEQAYTRLIEGKKSQDEEAIASALSDDFTAGMQTIMACAIALDAYYASIKERAKLPPEIIQGWRKKKTARYKQVAELFRRAFKIKKEPANNLREILKQIFSFRDRAVHPASGTTAPILHPELNKVSDWRYATFRYFNASSITKATLSILDQTSGKTEKANEQIESYCQTLSGSIETIIKRWEDRYGNLYE